MSSGNFFNPGLDALRRPNQSDGIVLINSDGDVPGTFSQRRETLAVLAGRLLKAGELAFTTDTEETYIGDGVTNGGRFLWQKPQWGTKNFENLVEPPATGAATESTSIVFPQMAIRQGYRFKVMAIFYGGAGDANFGIHIDTGIDWSETYGFGAHIRELWTAPDTSLLESREYLNTAATDLRFELASHPTQNGGGVIIEIDMMPRPNIEFGVDVESLGPIAVTACRKAGSGNSTTDALVYATCQRMWSDDREF